jgi:DNA-directed RNA polymerase subunit RPC12/RpoP
MENYECSMCGAQFGDRDALVNHLTQVHPTQKMNDFECTKCGAKFGSIEELVGHVASVHPMVVTA